MPDFAIPDFAMPDFAMPDLPIPDFTTVTFIVGKHRDQASVPRRTANHIQIGGQRAA
ncbi:hypothetical protein [Pseudophaeobacter leonis]|uniref:hypothetical protein n=1 Tax=Pseudophaeobacter leonis TaxID=1144477 RepID=UPI0013748211|nr:hypothetical protein [Pseudophaeobacter leonis]